MYLRTLSLDVINRIVSNGSTALHATAYYGHYTIVKLLLERGALRAQQNKSYHLTPKAEASNPEIKALFDRQEYSNERRFGGKSLNIGWIVADPNILERASKYRRRLEKMSNNLKYSVNIIVQEYINKLPSTSSVDNNTIECLRLLFRQARDNDDPIHCVKAYTMQSLFYKRLNEDLAETLDRVKNMIIIAGTSYLYLLIFRPLTGHFQKHK
ncbi:unnamed protein product [Didymodactylos carnosus]|uniref:Ankyrin repeat protein n=1 Tax=Didymodactylos carnosus TaxID=1234261 RepID=A0A814DZG1_9BILA|nr:unnamed protein product [Didymodactylos carnosus]CAF0962199.1 unnamed protein product [Didymodactylos carnosus]CAF3582135.1 unnamed protein product [Didymodactylos carnosus]CAF3736624.1 unnamed protein product [Didymodactylos carnosus]